MTDLYVTWDDYMDHTERLAIKVHDHGYKFNQIVCIAKGGLRVGDIIQRIFDVPLAIMSVESYHGDGVKNQQGNIVFGNSLAKTTPNLGNKVLLVDDLSDTGLTLNKSIDWLKEYDPIKNYINEIKTACLWKKKSSSFTPDFCPILLENDPWIVQPSEYYDEVDIEALKKKHS